MLPVWKSPNLFLNCSKLVTSCGSFVPTRVKRSATTMLFGSSGLPGLKGIVTPPATAPMKPAVLVPTPLMGGVVGTSSTYTPGDKYTGISFLLLWQEERSSCY